MWTSRKLSVLSLLGVLTLSLSNGAASEAGGASRRLLALRPPELRALKPEPQFPYTQCEEHGTDASPYLLELVSTRPRPEGDALTFRLVPNPRAVQPGSSQAGCRAALAQKVASISFKSFPDCKGAANDVRVNGREESVTEEWTDHGSGSLFKLTKFKLRRAVGSTITMTLIGKCPTAYDFFGDMVQYSFKESVKPRCCPVGKVL